MRFVRKGVLALLAGGLAVTVVSAGVQLSRGSKGYTANPMAGPGRTGVVFGTQWRGDSIWVFPSDVVSLVASGRLDKRLFEVTALAENGYEDGKRSTIPLIVQHAKGKPVSGRLAGATVGCELASAGSTVVQEDKQSATKFWTWLTGVTRTVPGKEVVVGGAFASTVKKVWLDGRVNASLDRSVPQIGAPAAWKKGLTSSGMARTSPRSSLATALVPPASTRASHPTPRY